jgi:hypothetical protein
MGLIFPKMMANGSIIVKGVLKTPPAGESTFPGPAKERGSDPEVADEYDTLSVDGVKRAGESLADSCGDWEKLENEEV